MENVFVKLTADGVVGYGEASPNAFYGESASDVLARITAAAPFIEALEITSVADISLAWHALWPKLAPSRAALCAVDLALWDWLAKREGKTVAELALGAKPLPVRSFVTIGVSSPAELEEKIRDVSAFPLIKLKSDARADLQPIIAARKLLSELGSHATLVVDANCAWEQADLPALSKVLGDLGVAFIEQPLPPGQNARMRELLASSHLPIMADESCVTPEDVPTMPGYFSGFNIKLVKCGGLTPALAMLRLGRTLRLRLMVGCMLESSLLIAAGAVIAQKTDDADLDGAWLLADDVFASKEAAQAHGRIREGILTPSEAPGFGVEPIAGLFD